MGKFSGVYCVEFGNCWNHGRKAFDHYLVTDVFKVERFGSAVLGPPEEWDISTIAGMAYEAFLARMGSEGKGLFAFFRWRLFLRSGSRVWCFWKFQRGGPVMWRVGELPPSMLHSRFPDVLELPGAHSVEFPEDDIPF